MCSEAVIFMGEFRTKRERNHCGKIERARTSKELEFSQIKRNIEVILRISKTETGGKIAWTYK